MKIIPGMIIASSAAMDDAIFKDTIIFIVKNDETGATGFVVNKGLGRSINELEEFKQCPVFPLNNGGPMGTDYLYFIHQRPDLINGGDEIGDGVFLGGDFSQVVARITDGTLQFTDIRIFTGYCGWDSNELEGEITEGSWTVRDGNAASVFDLV